MKTQCLLFFRLWCIICLSQYCTLQAAFGHDNLFRIEYGNRQYTLRDGLPNMLLETIFQDQDGFLWIGTYKGFARFDGYTFTPFLSETAFNILHFDTDMNGNIRAYTYHDYFVVDANDSIRSVRFAPDSIFLNTYNTRNLPVGYLILENYDATHKYLKRWQNDSLVTVLEIPQLDQIGESKPLLDLENEKLYLPSPQGVNIYDIRSKQVKLIKNLETEIFVKHKTWGILGFGTDGIYKFTENEHEKLTSYQFAQDIQAIETSDGSIIIKDMHSIYRFRNGILETLVSKSGGVIVDLLCDREGNLWSASHAGLCNYFRFDFKNFHLDNDKVKSVVEDSYGNHWFGTFYGKLIRRQGENSVLVNYPANMMKSFSFGATEQNKILYLPRDNDVLMYDQNRFWWAGLPGLPSMADGYSRVVPYKENQLLVLTQRGVHLCNQDGQSLHFFQENYFKQPDLQDLMIDSKGRWIVSGSIGLSIVGDTVQLFQGKNTAFTISICEDKQGRIWSGSENRLNLLKSDSVVTVHRFANDFILGLSSINDNHLLIETIQGIYIMNLLQDFSSSKVQFLLYNHRNGLTAQEPLVNGMYRDHQGILWMPCVDCLVSFEPEKLIRQVTPPVLHFQNCEISTNNVIWEKANLDKPFSYKFHNIKFSFIGLKYSAIENVRYTYRLKGFQEEWSKPSSIRETNFNNLPPGDYVFEVYADAGTDDSRTGIQQIRFNIQPAFWQTAWFPVISILLLMLLTTGIALSIQRKKKLSIIRAIGSRKRTQRIANQKHPASFHSSFQC